MLWRIPSDIPLQNTNIQKKSCQENAMAEGPGIKFQGTVQSLP